MTIRLMCCVTATLLSLHSGQIAAAPANPFPIEIEQPDHTKLRVKILGDERQSWMETLDGYTIVRNPNDCSAKTKSCWYDYAIRAQDGCIAPSGVRLVPWSSVLDIPLDQRPPKGLRPRAREQMR